MKNDRPTSLRMGFGFGQARAAGLGGIRPPRSPNQVNKITRANKANREAIEALREAAKDPQWKPYLEHRAQAGCSGELICAIQHQALTSAGPTLS
jgi:hypothetical protein